MKRKIKYLTTILLFVFLFYSIRGSFSRYKTENSGEINSTNLEFAGFVVNNQITDSLDFYIYNMAPGDTKELTFSVANNQNNKRSDVVIYYRIVINLFMLPLEVQLTDLTNNIVYTNSQMCTTSSLVYKHCVKDDSTNMKLVYSSNQTINYKITLTYPTTTAAKKYSYMNNSDKVHLFIENYQNP